MRYRLDVERKGFICVEADDIFKAYEKINKHLEDIVWDNWITFTNHKELK